MGEDPYDDLAKFEDTATLEECTWCGGEGVDEQLPLGLITVHCFDLRCEYVVVAATPDDAHEQMERHYDEQHALYIRSVTL